MNHQFDKLGSTLQANMFDAKDGIHAKPLTLKDGKYQFIGSGIASKPMVLRDGKYSATGGGITAKPQSLHNGFYSATGGGVQEADAQTAAALLRQKLNAQTGVIKIGAVHLKSGGWVVAVKVSSVAGKNAVHAVAPNGKFTGQGLAVPVPVVVKQIEDKSNATGGTQVKILGMPPLTFSIVAGVSVIGLAVGAYFIFKK